MNIEEIVSIILSKEIDRGVLEEMYRAADMSESRIGELIKEIERKDNIEIERLMIGGNKGIHMPPDGGSLRSR